MPIRVGNINQKYGFWNFVKLISDAVEKGHALSLQKNPGLFHAGISILKKQLRLPHQFFIPDSLRS